MCNELVFLKYKLPFMYDNFDQLIFVDYDLTRKCGSTDGSIEFLKSYPDPSNKIYIVDNFNPDIITSYRGCSFIEKKKCLLLHPN